MKHLEKYASYNLAVAFVSGALVTIVIFSYISMPLSEEIHSLLRAARDNAGQRGDVVSPDDPAFELLFYRVRDAVNQHSVKMLMLGIAVSTVFLAVLGMSAVNQLKRRVDLEAKNATRKVVARQNLLTKAELLATAFNEFNLSAVYDYEEIIQKKIDADLNLARVLNPIELATANAAISHSDTMLRHGMRLIDAMDDSEKKDFFAEAYCLNAYANLLNGFVYTETCKMILRGEITEKTLEDVKGRCEELLRITEKPQNVRYKRLHPKWWLAFETAGFFYIHTGRILSDQDMINHGRKYIEIITKREIPIGYNEHAPNTVLATAEREYCTRGLF